MTEGAEDKSVTKHKFAAWAAEDEQHTRNRMQMDTQGGGSRCRGRAVECWASVLVPVEEWQHLSNRNEGRCGGGEDKDVDIAVILLVCCGAPKKKNRRWPTKSGVPVWPPRHSCRIWRAEPVVVCKGRRQAEDKKSSHTIDMKNENSLQQVDM